MVPITSYVGQQWVTAAGKGENISPTSRAALSISTVSSTSSIARSSMKSRRVFQRLLSVVLSVGWARRVEVALRSAAEMIGSSSVSDFGLPNMEESPEVE